MHCLLALITVDPAAFVRQHVHGRYHPIKTKHNSLCNAELKKKTQWP
ncbi:hypothetical protein DEFR109230_11605 [Deinococcus frigens]